MANEDCSTAFATPFVAALEVLEETAEEDRHVSQRDRQERSVDGLPDECHDPPGLGDDAVQEAAQALALRGGSRNGLGRSVRLRRGE